jgi:NAD(P)-dependent dehydrogenase (short-subunit alcohol dehydrogenase family)
MNTPIALITGASRGLGRALAAGLAREGFALIIDARDATALEDAAAQIRAAGGNVTAISGDVTDAGHRAALRRAAEAAGRLDLLVNNAGTLGASPLPALADYPADELRAAFEVNVIAPIALTQQLLPLLRPHGGAVLNITSDAAVEAYTGWGGYGAAKAALEQASNQLAAEELAIRVWWAGGPTRATCAPTCTSRPSPARTSRTGRGQNRWSRPSSGSSHSDCRAAGTGPPT